MLTIFLDDVQYGACNYLFTQIKDLFYQQNGSRLSFTSSCLVHQDKILKHNLIVDLFQESHPSVLHSLQIYSMKYAHTSLSHSVWFEHIYVSIGIKNKIPMYADLINMWCWIPWKGKNINRRIHFENECFWKLFLKYYD